MEHSAGLPRVTGPERGRAGSQAGSGHWHLLSHPGGGGAGAPSSVPAPHTELTPQRWARWEEWAVLTRLVPAVPHWAFSLPSRYCPRTRAQGRVRGIPPQTGSQLPRVRFATGVLISPKGPPRAGPRAFTSGLLSWAQTPLHPPGAPDVSASLPCPSCGPQSRPLLLGLTPPRSIPRGLPFTLGPTLPGRTGGVSPC